MRLIISIVISIVVLALTIGCAALPFGSSNWACYWSGEGTGWAIYPISISIDSSGNSYVAGAFEGTVDLDPGNGEDEHSSNEVGADAFLVKITRDGRYLWGKSWGGGGIGDDRCQSVATDKNGNVYATGFFVGPCDMDPGEGVDVRSPDYPYVFLTKFDRFGNYKWSRTWGGEAFMMNVDWGMDVTIDSNNDVIVVGIFTGTVDFDPGPGTEYRTSEGEQSAFVSKLDSSGRFLWARTWGGSGTASAFSVACDSSDNIYTTGDFYGSVDFNPDQAGSERISNNNSDIFISKFTPAGDFQWVSTAGGTGNDTAYDIAVNGVNAVYICGVFEETVAFNPESGSDLMRSQGDTDIFLEALDIEGAFLWVRTWGGAGQDWAKGLTVDGAGWVWVTGRFLDTVDFDPENSGYELTAGQYGDIFLCAVNSQGALQEVHAWHGSHGSAALQILNDGSAVAHDSYGNVIVAGSSWGLPDLGPDIRNIGEFSGQTVQAFLLKMRER